MRFCLQEGEIMRYIPKKKDFDFSRTKFGPRPGDTPQILKLLEEERNLSSIGRFEHARAIRWKIDEMRSQLK